ncbi:MAG: carbohydrate kinase family protein [Candidatus Sumerlaeaceae bacterium]|nr:carbohydrate kinase family protein [Candidatus Sumerlaeaceae bacterium]
MSNRSLDVVVAGHVCLDIIPGFPSGRTYRIEDVFTPGKLVETAGLAISTGGPVSNTGIGLAKLGMKVAFMAKVGADQIGRMTLDLLKAWADTAGLFISNEESSSYTVALAPPGIDRIFFHSPGTNHTFGADNVNYDLVERARVFHLGYPPLMRRLFSDHGEELVEIFRRVKERGTTTSLDMALPDPSSEAGRADWLRIFERLLPYVDIFHPSAEEALFMARREKWQSLRERAGTGEVLDLLTGPDYTEMSDLLLGMGCAMVTLKSGHRGFYLRTGSADRIAAMGSAKPEDASAWAGREIWSPAYHVAQIASATGSGDSSLAGFTTAFLKGESPERCVAAGNALGYQNLHGLDAISGIRDWDYTLSVMADATLPRNPINTGEGWQMDPHGHVALGPRDRCL